MRSTGLPGTPPRPSRTANKSTSRRRTSSSRSSTTSPEHQRRSTPNGTHHAETHRRAPRRLLKSLIPGLDGVFVQALVPTTGGQAAAPAPLSGPGEKLSDTPDINRSSTHEWGEGVPLPRRHGPAPIGERLARLRRVARGVLSWTRTGSAGGPPGGSGSSLRGSSSVYGSGVWMISLSASRRFTTSSRFSVTAKRMPS